MAAACLRRTAVVFLQRLLALSLLVRTAALEDDDVEVSPRCVPGASGSQSEACVEEALLEEEPPLMKASLLQRQAAHRQAAGEGRDGAEDQVNRLRDRREALLDELATVDKELSLSDRPAGSEDSGGERVDHPEVWGHLFEEEMMGTINRADPIPEYTEEEEDAFRQRFLQRFPEVQHLPMEIVDQRAQHIFREEAPVITEKIVSLVNKHQGDWVAHIPHWAKSFTHRDAKVLMGYKRRPLEDVAEHNQEKADAEEGVPPSLLATNESVPENFDSRGNWPQCRSVMEHVRNQGKCGSCWAQSAAGAMDGRLCISSGGRYSGQAAILSAGYITSCYHARTNDGCGGSTPYDAFKAIARGGAPTGSDDGFCVPYFGSGDALLHFEGHHVKAPECPSECTNKAYPRSLMQDLFFDSRHPRWTERVETAFYYMYEGGPIAIGFDVYRDFMAYEHGYYDRREDHHLGGHATAAIGWTTRNGKRYVTGVNSWGKEWGEEGLFRMNIDCCALDYHIPFVSASTRQALPLP
eukprot:TRINITY_DN25678_c0_g1_i1.p1 TRINITY_DN25678_c0_g1~~TRINITY_DN25678_c0_g1_i1.p1  ORF type:complete len:523 (-),score=112.43 TRINITY_DN25678_c0_g1_i1:69-1637(-)